MRIDAETVARVPTLPGGEYGQASFPMAWPSSMTSCMSQMLPITSARVAAPMSYPAAGCSRRPGCSASSPGEVVLRGDLDHDNTLQAAREQWLAIDPHGVVGDPRYETGALLSNPWPERREAELLPLVPAQIEQLAAGLTMPVERVIAWGFVKAVLSSVWTC